MIAFLPPPLGEGLRIGDVTQSSTLPCKPPGRGVGFPGAIELLDSELMIDVASGVLAVVVIVLDEIDERLDGG